MRPPGENEVSSGYSTRKITEIVTNANVTARVITNEFRLSVPKLVVTETIKSNVKMLMPL